MNLNKGISTPIAIIIVVICAGLVGGMAFWQYKIVVKTGSLEIPFFSLEEELKAEKYIPQKSPSAFEAYNDFSLKEGESESFQLDKYHVKVKYLSSNPQTIRFSVDDKEKTITINENEGCETSYREECTVKGGEKECERVPKGTTCKTGICLKDHVSFGITAEKDNWDVTSLSFFSVITGDSCSDGTEHEDGTIQ